MNRLLCSTIDRLSCDICLHCNFAVYCYSCFPKSTAICWFGSMVDFLMSTVIQLLYDVCLLCSVVWCMFHGVCVLTGSAFDLLFFAIYFSVNVIKCFFSGVCTNSVNISFSTCMFGYISNRHVCGSCFLYIMIHCVFYGICQFCNFVFAVDLFFAIYFSVNIVKCFFSGAFTFCGKVNSLFSSVRLNSSIVNTLFKIFLVCCIGRCHVCGSCFFYSMINFIFYGICQFCNFVFAFDLFITIYLSVNIVECFFSGAFTFCGVVSCLFFRVCLNTIVVNTRFTYTCLFGCIDSCYFRASCFFYTTTNCFFYGICQFCNLIFWFVLSYQLVTLLLYNNVNGEMHQHLFVHGVIDGTLYFSFNYIVHRIINHLLQYHVKRLLYSFIYGSSKHLFQHVIEHAVHCLIKTLACVFNNSKWSAIDTCYAIVTRQRHDLVSRLRLRSVIVVVECEVVGQRPVTLLLLAGVCGATKRRLTFRASPVWRHVIAADVIVLWVVVFVRDLIAEFALACRWRHDKRSWLAVLEYVDLLFHLFQVLRFDEWQCSLWRDC